MAQQNIDFGAFPDDPSADAIRTAFQKVQTNFDQLFSTNANSTVNSINRTPGAGITVNYPTGNVVISANIACLLVATTSLKVGRGSDNTQSNVTITNSSQTLNIDIDPTQVLSNTFAATGNNLANLNGTLTSNSYYQPNINALGTLTSLAVSGNANFTGNTNFTGNANFTGATVSLGSNANLRITGGNIGQYLQTDGNGVLSWAAGGGGGNGSPGGINTSVQFNDESSFGANTGFTFNKTTGVLTTPSLTVSNTAVIGNLQGSLANGNSNINIPAANGNVTISAAGNANVFIVTGIGVNVASNLNVEDKISANRIEVNLITGTLTTNAQSNITSVGTLTSLDVTGNITAGNVYANSGTIGASLLTGTLTTNAQSNITSVGTLTSLSVTGNANVGNLNVANNAIITGNLSVLGNATYINIESLVVEDPIISLGGGPNGDPLISNDGKDRGTALQYYTTLPVTAFMGWDNSNSEFGFGSNVTITSEIVTFTNYGNVRASYFLSDDTRFGNANLGNTATANFFVGRFYGLANSATVANTVVDNAQPNITSVGTLTSLAVTGNTTSGNFVGTLANGNSNIRIAADSSIGLSATGVSNVLVVTSTGANVTGTFNVSGNLSAANLLGPHANGNSNVNIPSANGNINLTAVGNTTLVVTGTGANITGTVNVSSNANVGNLGTSGLISATGNITSASGVFVGNGAGLTNINAGNITGAYGNSQVATFLNAYGSNTITTTGNVSVGNIIGNGQALTGLAGGNVNGQVGNALIAGTVYTAAQGNITSVGTLTGLTVNGVSSLGDVANVRITGGNPIDVLVTVDGAGNLAWGTIGFESIYNGTSNVFVTNNGNITMYVAGNANARFTATTTGVVVNGTMSVSGTTTVGNLATAGTVTASRLISNVATGTAPLTVTSTTQVANLNVATSGTAGTVTTNAQPNITSVGTLTSLTVAGNVLPSANITYDLGSDTQRWKDLYLSNSTIYLGNAGATISANATAVIITNPGGVSVPIKPGGANTQVQYNDDGVFGGNGGLTFNEGTTTLTANNLTVTNNFTASGYILRSVGTAITAAGTTQGTGTALTKQMNIVSTVASGANGVILPTAVSGMVITVTNTTANSLIVYPATNGQINTLGANVGFTMGTTTIQFIAPSTTQWYTVGATYA